MEDVIGFLILLVTLIISVAASVKKQSGQNKTSEQSFKTTSDESAGKSGVVESSASQNKDDVPASWEEQMGYEEETGEAEEAEAEEPEEKEETPAGESKAKREESTVKATEAKTTPSKETYKTKKRRSIKRSKIQEIKERFDVEEGIIYSEILNRKYF